MKQGKSNGWHPMSISPTACSQGTSNEKTASQNRRDYIPYEGWMLKIDFAHMFVTKHPTWQNNKYHIDIVLHYHMYIQKVILLKSWLYISFLSWSYIYIYFLWFVHLVLSKNMAAVFWLEAVGGTHLCRVTAATCQGEVLHLKRSNLFLRIFDFAEYTKLILDDISKSHPLINRYMHI